MESKDWNGLGYFSPDFFPGMPVSQRIWTPQQNRVKTSSLTFQQKQLILYVPVRTKVCFLFKTCNWQQEMTRSFGERSFLNLFRDSRTLQDSIREKLLTGLGNLFFFFSQKARQDGRMIPLLQNHDLRRQNTTWKVLVFSPLTTVFVRPLQQVT